LQDIHKISAIAASKNDKLNWTDVSKLLSQNVIEFVEGQRADHERVLMIFKIQVAIVNLKIKAQKKAPFF